MGKIFSAVLTKSPNMPEPEDYEAHFLHCVDYMRQAAMCAGDLAIEPRGENGQPGQVNLVNAFNGLHGKCSTHLVCPISCLFSISGRMVQCRAPFYSSTMGEKS